MPNTQIADEALPLPWEEAVKHQELTKEKAARQFLALWQTHRGREDRELRWGEEIEYMLVDLGEAGSRQARAALCADEVLRRLGEETGDGKDPTTSAAWRTEFGNLQVEGVTYPPYGWPLDDVLKIEPSLAWRRRELARVVAEVRPAARVVTLPAFPLLGTPGATAPEATPSPDGEISKSVLCPDEVPSPHPRYQTFVRNYRKRKGCRVGAFIPREGTEDTLSPAEVAQLPFDLAQRGSLERDPVPGYIYMDAQAFGATQCCTQCTFLTPNISDARYLTDQYLVLTPLFLALTAATPLIRGLVAATDTRWRQLVQTWDDRQQEELGTIKNSRYSASDFYIGEDLLPKAAGEKGLADEVNDIAVPIHAPSYEQLLAGGLDPLLSRHVAHLLVRDSLMVYEDKLAADDSTTTGHWDQLQGTNWCSVRFKTPPTFDVNGIGWRVEFRTPEVGMTDFENAAIVAVVRVLTQLILEERWDLRIPISLCDANDFASGHRNAASEGLFWFRSPAEASSPGAPAAKQLKLQEILSEPSHGLLSRCRRWLVQRHEAGQCSKEALAKLQSYIALFERRASGELPTPATVLRNRLKQHPSYKGDGVVPPDFVHDLCQILANLDADDCPADAVAFKKELLGDLK